MGAYGAATAVVSCRSADEAAAVVSCRNTDGAAAAMVSCRWSNSGRGELQVELQR